METASRIHLCGPLRVEIAGTARELRGRQSRLVLGHLLLARGRRVRRDALIDALRTDAACSPPITEIRAFGHIQRKRGS